MENKQNHLQIGELSKETGVAVSALRYYQEVGLLEPCHISSRTKYRYYKISDISLAKFIKKSQKLGFSLDEIKEILNERDEARSPCPKVKKLAIKKINDLHSKIKELQQLEVELKQYITEAKTELETSPDSQEICGLIDKIKA